METIINNPNKNNNGKLTAGVIILFIGSILLIDQFLFVPHWLFSWPMWVIGYGLYMGGKYNFQKPVWIWTIIIGTAFLFSENIHNADRIIWPAAIIGAGAWMINRYSKQREAAYHGNKDFKEV